MVPLLRYVSAQLRLTITSSTERRISSQYQHCHPICVSGCFASFILLDQTLLTGQFRFYSFGAGFPLFATQMYNTLGTGGASSLLGGLA